MKIAYVIDEEPYFSEVMASALRVLDFEVHQFFDATDALNYCELNESEASSALMFIDMALEAGSDETIFSQERTDNYLSTGLDLAEEILERGIVSGSKTLNVILYSAHYTRQLWSRIDDFASKRRVRKWQKRADADLQEIFELASDFKE